MATRRQAPPAARPPTRLYLITPPIEDARRFTADLNSALAAADIAAVLLRLAVGAEQDLREAVDARASRPVPRGRVAARRQAGTRRPFACRRRTFDWSGCAQRRHRQLEAGTNCGCGRAENTA